MFSGTAQVSHQVCQFFVSSVCLLVHVNMFDRNRAVICCLLATSVIMLSEKKKRKRKMWSEKWYLKRNMSSDINLLNGLLETDVPWDDTIVVSAGELRKLWHFLCEVRSSLCERRLERAVVRPALLPVKTSQFTQFSVRYDGTSKIVQFNWVCIGRFMTQIAILGHKPPPIHKKWLTWIKFRAVCDIWLLLITYPGCW